MLLLYLAIQVNSLHSDLKANAPGVPAIWQAADVLQPLQAWKRFSCVFSSLRLAREKSQHSKGKLRTLVQNLNSLCSKWLCQLWDVPEPVSSCLLLLEEMDMYPADYRCRLVKNKLASAPKAVTKTLPKSIAVLILTFGMWICVADFSSLLRTDSSPVFSAVWWWSSWIHKLGKSKLYLSLNGWPHYKKEMILAI